MVSEVPPALTRPAIDRLPDGWDYLAVHGAGDIRAASGNANGAEGLRPWVEGFLAAPCVQWRHLSEVFNGLDPWGSPCRRDRNPASSHRGSTRVALLNPGRLPGGL